MCRKVAYLVLAADSQPSFVIKWTFFFQMVSGDRINIYLEILPGRSLPYVTSRRATFIFLLPCGNALCQDFPQKLFLLCPTRNIQSLDDFFTDTWNLSCILQRNGPWPKINLSNTWTCAWLWWTEQPALSSSCKAVEKTTADRWVHASLRHSSHNFARWARGGANTNIFILLEMGANWVQLEASSRGQQPVSGQPQRQDGRAHRGGVHPQPQPAVEVHPQFTIIGGATGPPGRVRLLVETPADSEACRERWKGLEGKRQTGWMYKSLSPLRRGTAGPVRGPLPRLNNLNKK